jgi:hypothetical protein
MSQAVVWWIGWSLLQIIDAGFCSSSHLSDPAFNSTTYIIETGGVVRDRS